jgi:predicted transcriptional regulator
VLEVIRKRAEPRLKKAAEAAKAKKAPAKSGGRKAAPAPRGLSVTLDQAVEAARAWPVAREAEKAKSKAVPVDDVSLAQRLKPILLAAGKAGLSIAQLMKASSLRGAALQAALRVLKETGYAKSFKTAAGGRGRPGVRWAKE